VLVAAGIGVWIITALLDLVARRLVWDAGTAGRVPRGGVRGVGCDGLLVNRELTGFGGQLGDY